MKKFTVSVEKEISKELQFFIVMEWVKKRPDIIKILLDSPRANCKFPFLCNDFPCSDLMCNADVCSNGYAYRMS